MWDIWASHENQGLSYQHKNCCTSYNSSGASFCIFIKQEQGGMQRRRLHSITLRPSLQSAIASTGTCIFLYSSLMLGSNKCLSPEIFLQKQKLNFNVYYNLFLKKNQYILTCMHIGSYTVIKLDSQFDSRYT